MNKTVCNYLTSILVCIVFTKNHCYFCKKKRRKWSYGQSRYVSFEVLSLQQLQSNNGNPVICWHVCCAMVELCRQLMIHANNSTYVHSDVTYILFGGYSAVKSELQHAANWANRRKRLQLLKLKLNPFSGSICFIHKKSIWSRKIPSYKSTHRPSKTYTPLCMCEVE